MREWVNKGYLWSIDVQIDASIIFSKTNYRVSIYFINELITSKMFYYYPEDKDIECEIKEHWRNKKLKELGI